MYQIDIEKYFDLCFFYYFKIIKIPFLSKCTGWSKKKFMMLSRGKVFMKF